jgi:hypothetical protein
MGATVVAQSACKELCDRRHSGARLAVRALRDAEKGWGGRDAALEDRLRLAKDPAGSG